MVYSHPILLRQNCRNCIGCHSFSSYSAKPSYIIFSQFASFSQSQIFPHWYVLCCCVCCVVVVMLLCCLCVYEYIHTLYIYSFIIFIVIVSISLWHITSMEIKEIWCHYECISGTLSLIGVCIVFIIFIVELEDTVKRLQYRLHQVDSDEEEDKQADEGDEDDNQSFSVIHNIHVVYCTSSLSLYWHDHCDNIGKIVLICFCFLSFF